MSTVKAGFFATLFILIGAFWVVSQMQFSWKAMVSYLVLFITAIIFFKVAYNA
jgi:hypothetical protein